MCVCVCVCMCVCVRAWDQVLFTQCEHCSVHIGLVSYSCRFKLLNCLPLMFESVRYELFGLISIHNVIVLRIILFLSLSD